MLFGEVLANFSACCMFVIFRADVFAFKAPMRAGIMVFACQFSVCCIVRVQHLATTVKPADSTHQVLC